VRERRKRGLGPETPFVLSSRSDGRVVLTDPATGRLLDLAAFGPDNAGAFAVFLKAGER
jgi:putative photosynthetic complex assembly protein